MNKRKIFIALIFTGIILIIGVSNFIYFYDPFDWRVQKKDLILHYELEGMFATKDFKPIQELNLSEHTNEFISIRKGVMNVTIELFDLYFYSSSFYFILANSVYSMNITYYDKGCFVFGYAECFNYPIALSWKDSFEHSFSLLTIVLLLEFRESKNPVEVLV